MILGWQPRGVRHRPRFPGRDPTPSGNVTARVVYFTTMVSAGHPRCEWQGIGERWMPITREHALAYLVWPKNLPRMRQDRARISGRPFDCYPNPRMQPRKAASRHLTTPRPPFMIWGMDGTAKELEGIRRALEDLSETARKALDAVPKREGKVACVLKTFVLVVAAFGVVNIIDTALRWFAGG